uniref:GED domain-containing protein n=1 Tax=Aegilops tauschii subsp. strangulata TaxID=200361 RepID=A0A453GC72_AEGTS
CREELFGDILREPDEITTKRRQIRDTLKVLQQAYKTLDEIPLEAETVERGYSLDSDATGLPRVHGVYDGSSPYSTPKQTRPRKSSHSGEQQQPFSGNGF